MGFSHGERVRVTLSISFFVLFCFHYSSSFEDEGGMEEGVTSLEASTIIKDQRYGLQGRKAS